MCVGFLVTVGIPIGIVSSAGIKKYNSIIKKRKERLDKIVLFAKTKLNTTEVLISKTLIESNTSHDEFVLVNDMLKEQQ